MATKNIFLVQPQPEGRHGFILTGPTLPYPMWYRREEHAVAFARQSASTGGGEVRVLDREGNLIRSEEIAAGGLSPVTSTPAPPSPA